jgi:hypothetical protein
MNTANALGAFKSKCREKFGDNKFLGINFIVALIRNIYLSPLIIKRFLQNRSPLTSMLISSDQHINMLRAGTYFPPSWKVRSWSPREAAPGDQERLALVAVELFLRNVRINLTFRLACTIFVKSVVTFSYGIIQSLPLDMGDG